MPTDPSADLVEMLRYWFTSDKRTSDETLLWHFSFLDEPKKDALHRILTWSNTRRDAAVAEANKVYDTPAWQANERLNAEVDRLATALERIRDMGAPAEVEQIARSALNPSDVGGER